MIKQSAILKESEIKSDKLLLAKQDYSTKKKQFEKFRFILGPFAIFQKMLLAKAKEKYEKLSLVGSYEIGNASDVLSKDKNKWNILNTYNLGTDSFLQPILVKNTNQHISLFGGSGSGKSVWLFNFLSQTLEKGGGFVFIDGKGDLKMFNDMLKLSFENKRQRDILVLNFNVPHKDSDHKKLSNSFNIFEALSLKDVRKIISSLTIGKSSDFFAKQTERTLTTIFYILHYLKDKGELVNFQTFVDALDLDSLVINLIPADPNNPDIPNQKLLRLNGLEKSKRFWVKKDYVFEGFIIAKEISSLVNTYGAQIFTTEEAAAENNFKYKPDEQLVTQIGGYSGMTISTIKNIIMPYTNVFNTPKNDVDFESVISQNKIVYVILPAMKMDTNTPHAIGAFILESLKNAASKSLGESVEFENNNKFAIFEELQRTANPTFPVVLDELAAFVNLATDPLGLFLAQARSINISTIISSQDVASLAGVEGGKTFVDKTIANTFTQIFLKTKDGQTKQYAKDAYSSLKNMVNEKGEEVQEGSENELLEYLKECKNGLGYMFCEHGNKFVTPFLEPKTNLKDINFKLTS